MVNLLLDTTVLVHLYRQRSEVITILQELKPRNIYISTVSYAEFLGATKKRQKQYARKFLSLNSILLSINKFSYSPFCKKFLHNKLPIALLLVLQ
jgi:predicted nucleic acid-binding protein